MRLAVNAAETFWSNDRGAVIEAVAGAFGESCDDAHAGLTRDGGPLPDAGAVYWFSSRFDLVARTEVVGDGAKLRQDRQPRTRCSGPPEKARAVLPGGVRRAPRGGQLNHGDGRHPVPSRGCVSSTRKPSDGSWARKAISVFPAPGCGVSSRNATPRPLSAASAPQMSSTSM